MSPPILSAGAGYEGHVHHLANGRDPRRVVEYLCHIPVIGHMDVGKEHDRRCPHYVEIPQRRTGYMETGKIGIIREPRMHAINGTDDILATGFDGPGVIHLVHAD